MANYSLSQRSQQRLQNIHPDLANIVRTAITISDVDFCVLEGLRSIQRQSTLFANGATKTMHSRHLTGHAVDLGAYIDGHIDWSWPLYQRIANAMKQSASDLAIPLEWGGDWRNFKDGPHFQLPWFDYPAKVE